MSLHHEVDLKAKQESALLLFQPSHVFKIEKPLGCTYAACIHSVPFCLSHNSKASFRWLDVEVQRERCGDHLSWNHKHKCELYCPAIFCALNAFCSKNHSKFEHGV